MPTPNLSRLLAVALAAAPWAAPFAQGNSPCWYTTEVLAKHLGAGFAAGKPEPDQGLGPGCTYRDDKRGLSLFVGTTPPDKGMPKAMLHKMLIGPASNKPVPVAGDPDAAVTVRHGGDIPPFPALLYERKGHTVYVHLGGGLDRGSPGKDAAIKAWNDKLIALPRVP